MDTTLSGNHNTGHEFRNLTLDELEQAQGVKTAGQARPTRAAGPTVLGVGRRHSPALRRASDAGNASAGPRSTPGSSRHYVPARGVLGVEFTDEERWQLVEYLKTL